MNPNDMPKHQPNMPVQGRYTEVARKWRNLSSRERWEDNGTSN